MARMKLKVDRTRYWPEDRFCQDCGTKLSRYHQGRAKVCYTCDSKRAEKMMARADRDIYAVPVELRDAGGAA